MRGIVHSEEATRGAESMITSFNEGYLMLDVLPNTYEQYSGKIERTDYTSYCEFLQSRNGRNVLKMLDEEDEINVG